MSTLAFIHVGKTGGQTVQTALRSSYGAAYCDAVDWRDRDEEFVVPKYGPADYRRLKSLCPFMKSVGGHQIALWSDLHVVEPVRYFAFVREPLRRGASHYQYHLRDEDQPLTWDEWVAWPVHQNHQVKMFSRDGSAAAAIRAIEHHQVFIGLTERYDESLLILNRLVARDLNPSYRRTNTARDNEVAQRLLADPATRRQIETMYGEEFALYEFVKEEWYPRWRREYGPTLADDLARFQADRARGFSRRNHLAQRLYQKLWTEPRARRLRRCLTP
jgi:hypothetical protein